MRLGICGVLLATISLSVPASADAAVIGSWTNTGNNYKFNVSSNLGNITSLELKFVPAPGSTFNIEFEDAIFDADGLLAGFPDSFLLFPASVTSPGATQVKNANVLQAAFTGFTPFVKKDVAQLIVNGMPGGSPLASNIAGTEGRSGTAVVETIAGDPNSRQEFPIHNFHNGDLIPPVVTPIELPFTGGFPPTIDVQLLATDNNSLPENLVWSNLTFQGLGKNPNFPGAADPTLSPSGVFHWNSLGWKTLGLYRFFATVTDEAGNQAVNAYALLVPFPEPASAWLLALGMIGFARVRR